MPGRICPQVPTLRGASDIGLPCGMRAWACRGVSRRVVGVAATVEQWRATGIFCARPGVARIIAAQLTARFPNGMTSLAILLHIEHVTGSYGAAGLVLAATSVGQAIAGPGHEPLDGRLGHAPRARPRRSSICAFAITAIALFETTVPGLHGARTRRRPVHPAGPVGRAHDLSEDGQLAPAHPAVLARRLAAGDHLDRRAGRHHLRRDAGRHGAGAAADRRDPRSAAARGSSSPPRSGASASRAAAAASARCSPSRRCCWRRSSASCSSARAPRSRRASSRRSAHGGLEAGHRARDLLDRQPRRRPVVRPHPDRPLGDGAPPRDRGVRALRSRSSRSTSSGSAARSSSRASASRRPSRCCSR